jgi:hypothetical protein
LLAPFLGESLALAPLKLHDHTVNLRNGVHCDMALGDNAAQHTFLGFLAAPGGEELLLHHTQANAAGADLAFLVQRPGASIDDPPRQRLVLVQVQDAVATTAAHMLSSVNLGYWYPDQRRRVDEADGKWTWVCEETSSHAAFRTLLAAHPDWCDPVRVFVSARPWSDSARLIAAWINYSKVSSQPLVLAQSTVSKVGVDIMQGAAGHTQIHSPDFAWPWWPTRIRHWPAGVVHPQASLPAPPDETMKAADIRPSHRVRFFAGQGWDLRAEAAKAGEHKVVKKTKQYLVVDYKHIEGAFSAVKNAKNAAASGTAGPAERPAAAFVHKRGSSNWPQANLPN